MTYYFNCLELDLKYQNFYYNIDFATFFLQPNSIIIQNSNENFFDFQIHLLKFYIMLDSSFRQLLNLTFCPPVNIPILYNLYSQFSLNI